MDVPSAIFAIEPILSALEHLHACGVAHRDVKPSNILLSEGRAVLADFGLVRESEDEDLTGSQENLGSFRYRPPEYLAPAGVADFRPGDVFSIAKTMWALVAGREPAPGDILRYPDHNLMRLLADSSDQMVDFQALINAMTQSDPQLRPSMADVREEVVAMTTLPTPAPSAGHRGVERLLKRLEASAAVQERQRDARASARIGQAVEEILERIAPDLKRRLAELGKQMQAAGTMASSGVTKLLPIDASARVLVEAVPELARAPVPLAFRGIFGCFQPHHTLPELEPVYLSFGCCVINGRTIFASAAGIEDRERGREQFATAWRQVTKPIFVSNVEAISLSRNLPQIVERQVREFESLLAVQASRVPD